MEDTLEERLAHAGMTANTPFEPGHTIRPALPDLSESATDETLTAAKLARRLPSLSVDLGDETEAPRVPILGDHPDLEIVGVLGVGGLGRVLLARQHSIGRDVAVKVAKYSMDEVAAAAIIVEGTITGSLEHPSIVPIHALGTDAHGRPAIVMKRVEGVSWEQLVADPNHAGWTGWDGTPDDRLLGHIQVLTSVCNALHYAHSRGVVHRDVKPDNVLIGKYGDAYLADWGVATRIEEGPGSLSGTPGYMAPEMTVAQRVDARTDVYLLGATLHHILTGEMRHDSRTALGALVKARLSEPVAYGENIPIELAELMNRACHLEPDERPQSALDFREALSTFVRHRDSRSLASQAEDRVARLESVGAREELSAEQRSEVDRWAAEAAFGLESALASWPDNPFAQKTSIRMDTILERRRQREAELEMRIKEVDPTIDSRPRAIASVLVGIGALSLAVSSFWFEVTQLSAFELTFAPAMMLVALLLGAFFMRRSILRTGFNRHVVASFIAPFALIVTERLAGVIVGIEPWVHFAIDGFILAGALAVFAVTLLRWVGWLSLLMSISAVGCILVPEQSLRIFGGLGAVALLLAMAFSWRDRS